MSTDSACSGSRSEPPGWAARTLLLVIEGYRLALSPVLGGFCRYLPSCSVYGQEAIRRHGARRGGWLALRRIARCHPFRKGGLDPVP